MFEVLARRIVIREVCNAIRPIENVQCILSTCNNFIRCILIARADLLFFNYYRVFEILFLSRKHVAVVVEIYANNDRALHVNFRRVGEVMR